MVNKKSKKPIKTARIHFLTFEKLKKAFLKEVKKNKTKMGRVLNKAIENYLEKNNEHKK